MTSLIRVQKKGQVTIPNQMRVMIGISEGDYVQVITRGRTLIIQPADVVPRIAADDYTPAQRKAIGQEVAKGQQDFKKGRVHGPFASAQEAAAYIENAAEQKLAAKKSKRLVR